MSKFYKAVAIAWFLLAVATLIVDEPLNRFSAAIACMFTGTYFWKESQENTGS